MPFPVINSSAVVQCIHGGMVQLVPKQPLVMAGGSPAMRVMDFIGSPIVGCPVPPSPGSKPCLVVVAPPATWASMIVKVQGMPAAVQVPGPSGVTDGVPPGMIMCTFAGQATVMG